MINKEVRKLYDELTNPTEALSKDDFLEKLIKIRNISKYSIYHELLSYTNKNELKELIKWYSKEDVGKQMDIKENLERESLNRLIWEKISILEIFEKYKYLFEWKIIITKSYIWLYWLSDFPSRMRHKNPTMKLKMIE